MLKAFGHSSNTFGGPAGGFPKSVCTSVNECLCHGIPDSRELRDGDTINIDVTVYLNVRPQPSLLQRFWHCSKQLLRAVSECQHLAWLKCAPSHTSSLGQSIPLLACLLCVSGGQYLQNAVGRQHSSFPLARVSVPLRGGDRGRCMWWQAQPQSLFSNAKAQQC